MKSWLLILFSGLFGADTTTDLVNGTELRLIQNRDAFLTGPHTRSRKAAALSFFDQEWSALIGPYGCGARSLGPAGKACIADRSRDGQWPWPAWYRDIIEGVRTVD